MSRPVALFLLDAAGLRAWQPRRLQRCAGPIHGRAGRHHRVSGARVITTTTEADIEVALEHIPPAVERLRAHGGG